MCVNPCPPTAPWGAAVTSPERSAPPVAVWSCSPVAPQQTKQPGTHQTVSALTGSEPSPTRSHRHVASVRIPHLGGWGGLWVRGRAFRGRHVVVVAVVRSPDPTRISGGDPQHRGLVLHRQVGLLRPVCVCASVCVWPNWLWFWDHFMWGIRVDLLTLDPGGIGRAASESLRSIPVGGFVWQKG